jgi:hypothetical protein
MFSRRMRLALEVRDQYQGSSSDAAYRLAQHIAASHSNSEWSDRSSNSPNGHSPMDKDSSNADDLQTTVINFLASLDDMAPGSLRRSGAINHRNAAQQTMLHIATVMGFHRLVRRLIVIGAHLDLQDVNGFTPLSFASLCGQVNCARVLIEAGAAYDRPTAYGEMPLDLAKIGERDEVENLLLSAVWSTTPEAADADADDDAEVSSTRSIDTAENNSEIDDDNPSSGSDGEVSRILRPRRSRKARGKRRASHSLSPSVSPNRNTSLVSHDSTPHAARSLSPTPADDPPPYEPRAATIGDSGVADVGSGSWMSRTLSNTGIPHPNLKIAENVFGRLPIPSLWGPEKAEQSQGWVAFPAPSWETLQKMASPEEVKLFTQAMAAAALNAVVQSTTSTPEPTRTHSRSGRKSRTSSMNQGQGRKKSRQGSRSEGESPSKQVVKHVKRESTCTTRIGFYVSRARTHLHLLCPSRIPERRGMGERALTTAIAEDRMLYLFWLPILLFVGFWLLVTALPIATGFCLIYARQITRAIKQRM